MSLNTRWEIHSPSRRHTRKHTNTHTSTPFHLAHPNYPSMLTESFSGPGHSKRSPAAQGTFTLPQPPLSLYSSVGKKKKKKNEAAFGWVLLCDVMEFCEGVVTFDLTRSQKVEFGGKSTADVKNNWNVEHVWVSIPSNSLSSCDLYSV